MAKEARDFVDNLNDCLGGKRRVDSEGCHWFIIVLTVAHVDHNAKNCADENLRAWCQLCHLHFDHEQRRHNAAMTRFLRKGNLELPLYA